MATNGLEEVESHAVAKASERLSQTAEFRLKNFGFEYIRQHKW